MWTDVVYVIILFLCVIIGFSYRKIDDPYVKQWACTIIGLIITVLVSGRHMVHPFVMTLINAIIITKLSPRKCHLASFFFSFFYLLVILRIEEYLGLSQSPAYTNLIIMILTLKLSGLAFEVNAASSSPPNDPEGVNTEAIRNVGIVDVFHYAFSYMGLLTGPYYRYRTYWDHLHKPFSKYVDPTPLTIYKLKQTACYIVLFLVMSHLYPLKYILTEEYAQRSFLYRHIYMYPAFVVFKLRMYVGMTLAECACQMAGLGVYPARCNPIQGLGPKDYKTTEALTSAEPEKLKEEEFNYTTIHNMNIWKLETSISTRAAMKAWNGCIQYWMGVYIYKRFPYKSLRTIATLALSAIWHGWAPGYFFCICQIPLFLMSEDIFLKVYNQMKEDSLIKKALWLLLWYERSTSMAYLGMPFLLLDFHDIVTYYKLVYCSGHIIAFALYAIARCVQPHASKERTEIKDKDK
ncbi:membrane bound O-acyltransferase domain containing farjavit [Calliopsis andreniformis]|uniref:membrane bound O-acyltransferase domain containing farjavit n=1 Tax=Calliopsis andreniformis TaxID=337506 RepID=UPI003FCCC3C5